MSECPHNNNVSASANDKAVQPNTHQSMARWYVCRVARFSNSLNSQLQANPDVFYPVSYAEQTVKGKTSIVYRPKINGYAFIKASLSDAKAFINTLDGVFIQKRRADNGLWNEESGYVVVPDDEMSRFIDIVNRIDNEMHLYDPREIDLVEGDRIRLVGGRFDGYEGVLVAQRGKDGGDVYLKIASDLYAHTIEVVPENIRVIEFAKSNGHVYDKLRSVGRRIAEATRIFASGRDLSAKQCSSLAFFLTRYADVELPTVNLKIDFMLNRLAVSVLLQHENGRIEHFRKDLDNLVEMLTEQMKAAGRSKEKEAKQKQIETIRQGLHNIDEAIATREAMRLAKAS